MAFAGTLMDYHLIFIIICFMLFFFSVVLIWLWDSKQSTIVAIIFLGVNQLFTVLSMMGFFSIGYIGYDSSTGLTTVFSYQDMQMYYMIFFALMWVNAILLIIAVVKYMRIVLKETLEAQSY